MPPTCAYGANRGHFHVPGPLRNLGRVILWPERLPQSLPGLPQIAWPSTAP